MSQDRSIGAIASPMPVDGGLKPKRTAAQNLGHFFRHKPLGAFGAVVAGILVLVAIFVNIMDTHDPYAIKAAEVFSPPNSTVWLGSDHLGRDVYSRIIHGARISLYVGMMSSFIGCTIGMIIGVASVHFGGITDLAV